MNDPSYARCEKGVADQLTEAGVEVAHVSMYGVMTYGGKLYPQHAIACVVYTANQWRCEVVVMPEDVRSASIEQAATAKVLAEMARLGHVVDQRTVPGCCE